MFSPLAGSGGQSVSRSIDSLEDGIALISGRFEATDGPGFIVVMEATIGS